MTDRVAFLLARIKEREDMARRASFGTIDPSSWQVVEVPGNRVIGDHAGNVVIHPVAVTVSPRLDHIAANDPAYVLADCAAKRQIVTLMGHILYAFDNRESGMWPDVNRRERIHAAAVLDLMVEPFADHPDFNPEWRQ